MDKPEPVDIWAFPDVEPMYPHCNDPDEVFFVPVTVDNFRYLIDKHNALVRWVNKKALESDETNGGRG